MKIKSQTFEKTLPAIYPNTTASIPLKAWIFWHIFCTYHIENQIKAEPSPQSAKQTFLMSCAGKNLGKCMYIPRKRPKYISAKQSFPRHKIC